jgi:hypothetical protein
VQCRRTSGHFVAATAVRRKKFVAAGTLDSSGDIQIEAHIFAREAGTYYDIDDGVEILNDHRHSVQLP